MGFAMNDRQLAFIASRMSEEQWRGMQAVLATKVDPSGTAGLASDAAIRAQRRRLHAAGRISLADVHAPISRTLTPAQQAAYESKFPDATRLGRSS